MFDMRVLNTMHNSIPSLKLYIDLYSFFFLVTVTTGLSAFSKTTTSRHKTMAIKRISVVVTSNLFSPIILTMTRSSFFMNGFILRR